MAHPSKGGAAKFRGYGDPIVGRYAGRAAEDPPLETHPVLHPLRAAMAAIALGALAACADGPLAPTWGADASLAATRTTSTDPALTVTGCDGTPVALSADERRTLDLHGETRRALGLPELCVDPTLTAAARAHSQEMMQRGFFSHDSFDGQSFDARIRSFGYPPLSGLAENVAWGTSSMGEASDVFGRWMRSEAHHHNIVDGSLRRIGVGVVAGTFMSHGGARMYTVDFGTP